MINSKPYSDIYFGKLTVVDDDGDDESPDVDLIYPAWDEVVDNSTIEFEYEFDDDVDVVNCSFELYNATKSSGGSYAQKELLFPLGSSNKNLAFEDNLNNNGEENLLLVDFDDGYYIWQVNCYDAAGNEGEDFNGFEVETDGEENVVLRATDKPDSYDKEDLVQDLIDGINDFLEDMDNLGADEQRALEILGLGENMNFYKKQLVQMDQDLKFNLKFMEEGKRTVRIGEIYDEIDVMKDDIVLGISVEDSYEYSKSSLGVSLEEVISDYMAAKGLSIKKSALYGLVDFNEELQNNLRMNVEALKLSIEYLDSTKDIVLVSKNMDFDDLNFDGIILEVIPEGISGDVVFVSEGEDLGEGIWELNTGDLDGDNIVYYFEDDFKLTNIEATESILFKDEGGDGNMMTGFFIGVGEGLSFFSFFFLVGFLFLGYVGFFIFGKVKMETWKKEPNVVRILDLISQSKMFVRENNVEAARDNYHKMGEIYKVLPEKCKPYFYKEIGRVRLVINKRDVMNLVKEYEKAKDEFRKEDAVRLHAKINDIYKKLPKKFQDKIYQRIVKREVR